MLFINYFKGQKSCRLPDKSYLKNRSYIYSMEMKEKGQIIYFENLDGLRFFCFLFVFLFHSFQTDDGSIKQSGIFQFIKQDLFGNGFLGVNFFFVLSGFLITYLLVKEKQLKSKINIPNFWLRRVLRIWPLFYLCVGLGFIIFPLAKTIMGGIPTENANPWYYLLFINNFDYINKGLPDAPGLGVLWSVAIEEQFYLTWPLILSLFPPRKFWIPLVLIIGISLSFRAVHDEPILHEMHTLSCIGDMAIGGLGAWLVLVKPGFLKYITDIPRIQLIIIYLLFFGIFLFRDEYMLQNYAFRIVERMITAMVMLMIILEQCFAKHSFYKMSSFRIPSRLGIITYGLYCFHFIFISAATAILQKIGWAGEVWEVLILQTALALGLTIIISMISFRFFERPFLKIKDRFGYFHKT